MITTKLTLRGVVAHKWRLALTALAVVFGVGFASASFILTDSLKRSFNDLFAELSEGIDLQVRSSIAFGDEFSSSRDPLPVALVDTLVGVDGVERVVPALSRTIDLLDTDGEAVSAGGPTLAVSWIGDDALGGGTLIEGAHPEGPDQMVMDKSTANRVGYEIGDTVTVVGPTGRRDFTLVGLVGQGDSDGFAGAVVTGYDLDTALDFLDTDGRVDAFELAVVEGADIDDVADAVTDALPEGTEVITGEELGKETADGINEFIGIFGNVLLGFAVVILLVSSFLIFNTFTIIIGQRLRELALLRAVGASGPQVRGMLFGEALVVGIVSTIVGLGFGVIVSKGLVALFNAAGAGFPSAATVITTRTLIAVVVVGVGVTLAASLVPALRAAKIPPIAAMHPEAGFSALASGRRAFVGIATTAVGAGLFMLGIFARPGGTIGTLLSAGLGAVMVFIGMASVSTTFAKPAAGAIGAPVARVVGLPGRLARENAQRSPRRTASTASALMIGVALISAVSLLASSVRATFLDQLSSSITADFFITGGNFGLPPAFAADLAEVEELSAVSPFRATQAQVDGETKSIGAVSPTDFGDLVDVDLTSGSFDDLDANSLLLHKDPARDLAVGVGDTVTLQWQNGATSDLTVAGVYDDGAVAGNWLVSTELLDTISSAPAIDFFVGARIADGVAIEDARAAVEEVAEKYPSVTVEDQAEFRASQEAQLDQLLLIINALLGLAVIVAVIGIANTIALSVFERTREFGLLRAIGMDRKQLKRSVRWEAVIVAVFGALLGVVVGLPLGLGVAWALPDSAVSIIAIPWGTIVVLLVLSVVVGLVAAWLPARRAAKLDILDAIATT